MALGIRARTLSIPSMDRKRILGLVLAAIAALLVLLLTKPPDRIPVLIASADIAPGQALTADDVSVRYVESAEGFVQGSSLGDLDSWSLRAPIAEGEPLVPSLLQPPELREAPNVIALSLDESHAVLGRLVPGDRVDVYVTVGNGLGEEPVTRLVATGVYVVESRPDGDGIGADRVNLLLAVDEALARIIAGASRSGAVDLVRVSP
jgi:Flp pilus assembly protein CpaB